MKASSSGGNVVALFSLGDMRCLIQHDHSGMLGANLIWVTGDAQKPRAVGEVELVVRLLIQGLRERPLLPQAWERSLPERLAVHHVVYRAIFVLGLEDDAGCRVSERHVSGPSAHDPTHHHRARLLVERDRLVVQHVEDVGQILKPWEGLVRVQLILLVLRLRAFRQPEVGVSDG